MKDRVLYERFSHLSQMLKELGLPDWESVYFVEGDMDTLSMLQEGQLKEMSEFADRFDEILGEGHAWINMSGLGLFGKSLIVGIEEPNTKSTSYKAGASTTSVNISGPMRYVQERNYDLSTFMDIKE